MRRPSRSGCALRARGSAEQGSAIVDFALVSVVLLPMFFAILQLALIWHVRTTLTSAASEGARFGAAYQNTPKDGADRTASVIDDALGAKVDDRVAAAQSEDDGHQMVTVTVRAEVPVVAFWGPTTTIEVEGHAIKEILP